MEDGPELVTMYKLLFCSPQPIATFVRFQKSTWVALCKPGASSWQGVRRIACVPARARLLFMPLLPVS
ncbi:hypothetical protein EJB05_26835, partial [Eragrostis curvula]